MAKYEKDFLTFGSVSDFFTPVTRNQKSPRLYATLPVSMMNPLEALDIARFGNAPVRCEVCQKGTTAWTCEVHAHRVCDVCKKEKCEPAAQELLM